MTYSLRRHRRQRFSPRLRVAAGAALCLLVLAAAIWALVALWPARVDREASRYALARSIALLAHGNPTSARNQAVLAVRADPKWPLAHTMLARTQLALDDGLAAEAELRRAIDTGFDARRVSHLLGEAMLLQGDPKRALQELARPSLPRYRSYALRVRGRALAASGDYDDAEGALSEATRITPRDADAWADLGRFRFGASDLAGAITATQQALALNKGNLQALVLRGELVRSQYGLMAALPWFEAALKRDPWYHDALIEYAASLGDIGRTNDMLAYSRRALQARPGSPEALYLQAVLAARADNFALARELVQKTNGTLANLPGMLLLGGTLDLDEGADQQAVEKFQQLVDMQPTNITARKLLATALLRTDAARNAIETLAPVVARGDADAYAFTLTGRGYERIADRNAAAQMLDRSAQPVRSQSGAFSPDDSLGVLGAEAALAPPGDPATTVPLIRGLVAAGNTAGALNRAQELARLSPGVPAAWLLVGDVLMLSDRAGDAVQPYRHAADLRFDEPTMLRLVEALERSGRHGQAANALALFLSQNPSNVAALRLAAQWQLAAGDFDNAVASLEDLRSRLGNRDVALLADLTAAYAGSGDAERAARFGEAAYALAPSNPAVVDAYGWALYQAGDRVGALQLLTKAAGLAPGHPGIKAHYDEVAQAARS